MMLISREGISLIKAFEGCKLEAYKCPAGVWTIGYGHTLNVKEGDILTSAEAERKLLQDISPIETRLNKSLGHLGLHQLMFDALVSFSFNVGYGWLAKSKLAEALRSSDFKQAADELLRWNKAGGRILAGLTARRSAERDLFLRGYHRLIEL